MKYNAKITNVYFQPMVKVIPSILTLEVKIAALRLTVTLEEIHGSIETLSKKYKFAVSKNIYDFGNYIGKDCIVERRGDKFYFDSFDDR